MAAEALGIDFSNSSAKYVYRLKDTTHNNTKELSPHFGTYK
jgi:hypothetical protein